MNQLQTVLDKLEPFVDTDDGCVNVEILNAMAIINQMMQAEPVAFFDKYGELFNEVEKLLPTDTPLYAAPQAVVAAPQAVPEWLPIESAPKDGTLVVLYSPNGPDDWPDSFKVTLDYFCKDYENWFHHSEAHEHYMAVGGSNACGPDAVCTGPSEKAPYTHWMPLPAPPKGAV